MREKLNQKHKIKFKEIFAFCLMIGIISLSCNVTLADDNVSQTAVILNSLTPHSPIIVNSDNDLLAFPGNGTVADPYLIEGYNITTTSDAGIDVSGTTKHFEIRNCYIDANIAGIFLNGVDLGTATIDNVTCTKSEYGIYVRSNNATITNSDFSNNVYSGIYLNNAANTTVIDCICNNGGFGILSESSTGSMIVNNTFIDNSNYGIILTSSSDNCTIFHNSFIDNKLIGTSQAYDDGIGNIWYNQVKLTGNFWNNWISGSYSIDGSASSVDPYPLGTNPHIPEFNSNLWYLLIAGVVLVMSLSVITRRRIKS